ncbi:hypothetical protein [uncultured Pseudodesulfovibrio sp.]|uniref:hypothetical protein n=1 Tax=uncultured Pseudodesulfovibrio sp. TaxID=2035858 RepID=UPI0029C91E5D|nr:hypothetical protein [uncultured Pseudodesulfovibrio sp.]
MVVIIGFVWFGFRDKSAGQWIWTLANHYDTYTSRWIAPDPIGDAGGQDLQPEETNGRPGESKLSGTSIFFARLFAAGGFVFRLHFRRP